MGHPGAAADPAGPARPAAQAQRPQRGGAAAVRRGGGPAHRAVQPAGPGQGAQQPQPGAPGGRSRPAGPGRPAPLRAGRRPGTGWPCTSRSARSTSAAWTWWPATCPRPWARSPRPGPSTSRLAPGRLASLAVERARALVGGGPVHRGRPGTGLRGRSRPPRSGSATPTPTRCRCGRKPRCWRAGRRPPRSGPGRPGPGSSAGTTRGGPPWRRCWSCAPTWLARSRGDGPPDSPIAARPSLPPRRTAIAARGQSLARRLGQARAAGRRAGGQPGRGARAGLGGPAGPGRPGRGPRRAAGPRWTGWTPACCGG